LPKGEATSTAPDTLLWSEELERGLVVAGHLLQLGRQLVINGETAKQVPLMLVDMASKKLGSAGKAPQFELPGAIAAHRFFVNPIRHTSLGLAVFEAMLSGLPMSGCRTWSARCANC
jgi:glycosyltransferase involved in cell wall biosynthesis